MTDVSKEKQYLLYALILSLLGGIPYIGIIFAIIAVVLYYAAFKGYEEKLGLTKPKKYYLYSLVIGIVGMAIVLGVVYGTNYMHSVENSVVSFTNNGNFVTLLEIVAPLLVVFWLTMVGSVYYSTLAFVELGKFFNISEFFEYRKFALIAVVGMPLWFIIPLFGFLVFFVLAIIGLVYLFKGIGKLPESYSS